MGVCAFATLAAALCSSDAAAQTADRADRLFDSGIADLKLGKYEAACAALEQSHELEPNLGALLALSDCLERWGKVYSASVRYEEFVSAASSSGSGDGGSRGPQLTYARSALARLAAIIPVLHLTLPTPSAEGVRIVLDGKSLNLEPPAREGREQSLANDPERDGAAASRERQVAIDPGHHVIETHAEGHEAWRLELDVQPGERPKLELALGRVLEEHAPASLAPARPMMAGVPAPDSARTAAPAHSAAVAPALDSTQRPTSPWRTLGWGLGGLGVAGVGVGVVAGVMVLQTCPSFHCDPGSERGENLALVADIGFGVGLAALAASAIVLLSTEPAARADNAWRPLGVLDARGGWLGLSHEF